MSAVLDKMLDNTKIMTNIVKEVIVQDAFYRRRLGEKVGCCRNCNNHSSWSRKRKLRKILQEFIILKKRQKNKSERKNNLH